MDFARSKDTFPLSSGLQPESSEKGTLNNIANNLVQGSWRVHWQKLVAKEGFQASEWVGVEVQSTAKTDGAARWDVYRCFKTNSDKPVLTIERSKMSDGEFADCYVTLADHNTLQAVGISPVGMFPYLASSDNSEERVHAYKWVLDTPGKRSYIDTAFNIQSRIALSLQTAQRDYQIYRATELPPQSKLQFSPLQEHDYTQLLGRWFLHCISNSKPTATRRNIDTNLENLLEVLEAGMSDPTYTAFLFTKKRFKYPAPSSRAGPSKDNQRSEGNLSMGPPTLEPKGTGDVGKKRGFGEI